MKITKKNVGIGVAIIIILGVLWSVLKPAPAEAADVNFTFGAEKQLNANTNKMYLDSSVDLPFEAMLSIPVFSIATGLCVTFAGATTGSAPALTSPMLLPLPFAFG